MKKIIDLSIKHPISVLMYFFLVIILGGISVFALKASLLPQTNERWIIVTVPYKGVKAEEIRKLITIPLEENLSCLKNIKNLESVSRDEIASLKIELKWNSDHKRALLETNAIIDSSMENLPEDCPRPMVKSVKDNYGKIKIFVIPIDKDILSASAFAQNELKSSFIALDECARMEFMGLEKKIINVLVDSELSAFHKLSLEEIVCSMNNSNFDYPAGTIEEGENEMLFKTEGSYKDLNEIMETSIINEKKRLKLKDLARISSSKDKEKSFCIYNGQQCVGATVFCKKNANPMFFSFKVKRIIKEINCTKKNFKLIIAEDSSDEIKSILLNLFLSSLVGVFISFLLIIFFFKSFKIAGIISFSIPFCVLFSFLILKLFGRSANIISITGITICLGMVIDNSIVAMESIVDCVNDKNNYMGKIEFAIEKIILPNTASTITTIIAFVPIFFVGGIIGELFIDLGITILSGMAFSLFYSFTFLPAVCVLFFKNEFQNHKKIKLLFLENNYKRILEKTNKIKCLWAPTSFFSLIVTIAILIPIKKELQPRINDKNLIIQVNFEPGHKIESIKQKGMNLTEGLLQIESIKNVWCEGGIETNNYQALANPENQSENLLICIEAKDPKRIINSCKRILDKSQLKYSLIEKNDLICERLSIKNKCLLLHDNFFDLQEKIKGLFINDYIPNYYKKRKEFKANKNYMQKKSLTPLEFSKALKEVFDGCEAFPYYENGREIPIKAIYEKNSYSSETKLKSLNIICQESQTPLYALGSWEESLDESILYRFNGKDAKIISEKNANKIQKEESENLIWLRKNSLNDFFSNSFILALIVFVLLYCIIGAQTESFTKPIIYFISVLPAFLGASFFLILFHATLNINSVMAFVALFGMSVNNSILLSEGGIEKFSSALITTFTSVVSLLPFAIDPFKNNPQSSLALALVGGLLFSAAASFILIPNIQENQK